MSDVGGGHRRWGKLIVAHRGELETVIDITGVDLRPTCHCSRTRQVRGRLKGYRFVSSLGVQMISIV